LKLKLDHPTNVTSSQLLKEIYKTYVKTDEQGELDYNLRPFTDRITDRILETTPRIGRKKRIKKAAQFQEKGRVSLPDLFSDRNIIIFVSSQVSTYLLSNSP